MKLYFNLWFISFVFWKFIDSVKSGFWINIDRPFHIIVRTFFFNRRMNSLRQIWKLIPEMVIWDCYFYHRGNGWNLFCRLSFHWTRISTETIRTLKMKIIQIFFKLLKLKSPTKFTIFDDEKKKNESIPTKSAWFFISNESITPWITVNFAKAKKKNHSRLFQNAEVRWTFLHEI